MSADLETRIQRALRALPPPQAPVTLVPRVMRAVEARVSAGWRAVALAGGLAAAALLLLAAPWLAAAAGWGDALAQAAGPLAGLERLLGAATLIWQAAAPAAGVVAAVVFGMGALAAACGLALGRVTRHVEG